MKKVREGIFVIIVILFVYGLFHLFGFGCPIKFISGISCAGCGMTRAAESLLRGDVAQALYYHPLIFLVPIYFIFYLFRKKMGDKSFKVITVFVAVIFMVVYAIRLFDTNNSIVVFEPKNGLIVKIFNFFRGNS